MEAHLMLCAMPKLLGFGLGATVVDMTREMNPFEVILILEIPEEMSGLFFMTHRPDMGRYVVVVGLQG